MTTRKPYPDEAPVSSSGPASSLRARGLGSTRVLIAERDPALRASLKPLFRSLGAQIDEVDTGPALESLLLSQRFDLVIAAAQLPLTSGLQVLAKVRSKGDKTPFIVITSQHAMVLRVMVSDCEGTVLSSRVVDGDNLLTLAGSLIRASRGDLGAPKSTNEPR